MHLGSSWLCHSTQECPPRSTVSESLHDRVTILSFSEAMKMTLEFKSLSKKSHEQSQTDLSLLEHFGTCWNMLEHVGTFWNL